MNLVRLLLPFALVSACKTPEVKGCDSGCEGEETGTVDEGPWDPLVLGHRGTGVNAESNPFAENTLLSFQQAMVEGADGVEVDVHQTSDGVLVLIHEELLDESTDCGGCVVSSTYKELQDCQALNHAGAGQSIPTLDQVLQELPAGAFINIEIKSPEACLGSFPTSTAYVNASAVEVVNSVSRVGAESRVQISSFDRDAIRMVEDLDASLHTALVWSTGNLGSLIEDAVWAGADTMNGHSLVIYDEVWESIDEADLGMWLWGIELASDVTRVSQWTPGALITDHPEVVSQTLIDMGLSEDEE